jgi:nucleotide-binding universal stress UspA family protein
MKKIIVAIDGLKYSQSATEYGILLAKENQAHLVGIFLDDLTYHSYKIGELVHSEGGVSEEKIERFTAKDREKRDLSAQQFENACRDSGVNFSIHHDRNVAIHELVHETVYSDLLVIDRKETLTHYEENLPTRFIKDLLINAECPVLLVPQHFQEIKKNVLLYDGEPPSVNAIKVFSYLFPAYCDRPTEVISVKPMNDDFHLPQNRLMKEFMKRHFKQVSYTVLKGLPEIEMVNHLEDKDQHELIVMGSYRRGMVSRWIRPSMTDELMRELQIPIFIAQNK